MTETEKNELRELYRVEFFHNDYGKITFYPENFVENGTEYNGFSDFSAYIPKVMQYEPKRSGSGAMEDLNAIPRFETPRLRVNFKYMTENTYILLQDATDPPEYDIAFYVPRLKTRIRQNMYCLPKDYPKLTGTWELNKLAMLDETVEFVATLREELEEEEQ